MAHRSGYYRHCGPHIRGAQLAQPDNSKKRKPRYAASAMAYCCQYCSRQVSASAKAPIAYCHVCCPGQQAGHPGGLAVHELQRVVGVLLEDHVHPAGRRWVRGRLVAREHGREVTEHVRQVVGHEVKYPEMDTTVPNSPGFCIAMFIAP